MVNGEVEKVVKHSELKPSLPYSSYPRAWPDLFIAQNTTAVALYSHLGKQPASNLSTQCSQYDTIRKLTNTRVHQTGPAKTVLLSVFQTKIGKNSPNYSNRYPAESYRLFLSIWERFTEAKLVNFQERYGAKFLNVISGLNQPETDDPCARGRETKHKEARESNIIWRELKHRRNTSLRAEQRGAIKLVAFAENSKHNNGQNKGQKFPGISRKQMAL